MSKKFNLEEFYNKQPKINRRKLLVEKTKFSFDEEEMMTLLVKALSIELDSIIIDTPQVGNKIKTYLGNKENN